MKEFDTLDLFPRVNGRMPVIVIDGHQSRLDPAFIAYINNPAHLWKVCLGVPYATRLWQVGDASEQNGAAKTEWYREKSKVVSYKNTHQLPCKIDACDCIPLVNKFFSQFLRKYCLQQEGYG